MKSEDEVVASERDVPRGQRYLYFFAYLSFSFTLYFLAIILPKREIMIVIYNVYSHILTRSTTSKTEKC